MCPIGATSEWLVWSSPERSQKMAHVHKEKVEGREVALVLGVQYLVQCVV